MVANLEIHLTVLPIIVAFLARLGCFEVVSDLVHLLFCVQQNSGSKDFAISGLRPIEWGSALPSIQSFKRGHLYAALVTVVVGKFSVGQTIFPSSTKVNYTCSQHVLKYLVDSLYLSICLGVVCSTET